MSHDTYIGERRVPDGAAGAENKIIYNSTRGGNTNTV